MGWKCALAVLVPLVATATGAAAECRVLSKTPLTVTLSGNRPLVDGAINGKPVRALLDTGAELSLIWRSEAQRLGLKLGKIFGARVQGVGGMSALGFAKVETLTIGEMTGRNFTLAVAGEGEMPFAFVLGQDFLSKFDIEFDLAKKLVTLFRTEGCEGMALAYWSKEWQQADLRRPYTTEGNMKAHIRLPVEVNGIELTAMLDSGAPFSTLTLPAARKVGITPDSADTIRLGKTGGVGPDKIDVWGATFTSFRIGDETIYNAKIRMADLYAGTVAPRRNEMILGSDFLQAHRVMLANSQRRLYFTYNGGPVFQVVADARVDASSQAGPAPSPELPGRAAPAP